LAQENAMNRRRCDPLLCELHAHTTWSDGELSVRELVDLYGSNGFDVLCVTDHLIRLPEGAPRATGEVTAATHGAYLAEIDAEAERASLLYDLLVVPGLELTYEDNDPQRSAHAVAVGLRTLVELKHGLDPALTDARSAGAALIAAHPYEAADLGEVRRTSRWSSERAASAALVDRFELFNRHELFAWVAEERLPAVASGDFHRLEHLLTWKTLLPCPKEERAVVDYLRSGRPAYFVHLAHEALRAAA
jgi:predicted metal-dependent phosphoesterase TrpH